MKAWSHLPNAALIDEVLASLKAGPEKWNAALAASQDAAWGVIQIAVQDAAKDAVRGAIATLVAYDEAGQFMKLPVDHLQRLYRIDPHPMFLLPQPAAIVFSPRAMSQGSSDEVPLLQS